VKTAEANLGDEPFVQRAIEGALEALVPRRGKAALAFPRYPDR